MNLKKKFHQDLKQYDTPASPIAETRRAPRAALRPRKKWLTAPVAVAMAILLTGTPGLVVYLPVMIVCSIITGFFTGLCAQFLVNRGKDFWKTTFR